MASLVRIEKLSRACQIFTAAGNVAMQNQCVLIVKKASGAATTVTLPPGGWIGQEEIVKDGKGDAATNNITVQGVSPATIDGGSTYVISTNYGSAIFQWNGAEWGVVGGSSGSGSIQGDLTITSISANAIAAGRQGATSPVLQIDASTSLVATGVLIKGAAAGAKVAMAAISSGNNEDFTIDAKGSGQLTLQSIATGAVGINSNMAIAEAKNITFGSTTGTKIGTTTSQKIGFWNSAPVVQQTAAGNTAYNNSGATAVNTAGTFTGGVGATNYTIGDIVAALKTIGIIAA